MAVDRITVGSRILVPGSITLGPVQIASSRETIQGQLDTTQHMNPGVMLTIAFFISFDAGDTWIFVTSSSRNGGVVFDDDGQVDNTIRFALALPPEQNNVRRRIRLTVTLEGGTFTTGGGFLEASD